MLKCSPVEYDLREPDRERVINGLRAPPAGGLGELASLKQTHLRLSD